MLKLKYLFDNRELARMLLLRWERDNDDPLEFQYFRISSNAIYPFRFHGEMYFLRFAPEAEKAVDQIKAELDFIRYLHSCGLPVIEAIKSLHGNELETVSTPWGIYHVTVFKRVKGESLNRVLFTDEIITGWGEALGTLHKLSSDYTVESPKRKDWRDQIREMIQFLQKPGEAAALSEAHMIYEQLAKLPSDHGIYGLIHYDFETDNVFYEQETGQFYPIDFDDAVYHWYVQDIERALDSLNESLIERLNEQFNHESGSLNDRLQDNPSDQQNDDEVIQRTREEKIRLRLDAAYVAFINGYRKAFPVTDTMLDQMSLFSRYGKLFGYVRILRSLSEKWSHEPEWMVSLRNRLNLKLEAIRQTFGSTH